MDLLSLPVAVFAAVAAALLSRSVGKLWLRAVLVVAVAYASAFTAVALVSRVTHAEGQFASWAPLLMHLSFGAGAVVGVVVLVVSHWLLKPRRSRGG